MDALQQAKAEVKRHQREMREAISAGEWMRASTAAHQLSERLEDVAALVEEAGRS